MTETTASHHLVDMPPKVASPAASSHDAVEPPPENESGPTGAATLIFGCCSIIYLVILVLVALLLFPVALLIWCLYKLPDKLPAKLIGSKGVLSQKTPAENESFHNAVESGRCSYILHAAVVLLFFVVLIIWCLFWLLCKLLLIEVDSSPRKVAEDLNLKLCGTEFDFKKLEEDINGLVNEGVAAARWRVRILLLLLLSLVIVLSVPGLKRIKVLGLPLWIWMVMPTLLIFIYHYIRLLGQSIENEWKETAVMYYLDGLRRSGYWLIVCVVILLVWELHFRSPRHGLQRYGVSKKVHHIGTSLAISLLVGASLALVKNWLILLWESHTIFRRCTTTKISEVGEQLYFLGLVYGYRFDLFSPHQENPDEGISNQAANIQNSSSDKGNSNQAANINNFSPDNGNSDQAANINNSSPDKGISDQAANINNSSLDKENSDQAANMKNSDNNKKESSNYVKKKKAEYFITIAKMFSREDITNGRIPKNVTMVWKQFKARGSDDENKYITKESLKKKLQVAELSKNDIDCFFKKLRNGDESKDKEPKGQDSASTDQIIAYKIYKEWMEKAFINCVLFGYTLVDAQRAKNKLDIIFTVFLVIVAVLCFPFLAGIASTKVLVTIWTSFAAAAFIFGDMLKAFFEGIIFVFVMHPLNVGDLCIIDNIQLEVNTIDVLKTTFHRIDNKDEVLYPNKVLAGKTISNLKWHLNKEDYVELSLRPPVGIGTLEKHIEGFFNKYSGEFEKPRMQTKEIGEFIKIAIHFKHIIQDDTHVGYFKKKNEQRSKLLKKVLDHIETKESSSTNNTVKSLGQKTRETTSSSTKNTIKSSGQRTCKTASSSTKNMAKSLG